MVNPQEIFLGFSRYYNSLGVAYEESISTNTNRIISYLDLLGRMLGHRIFSEMTCSTLFEKAGKDCPLELRRKKPDVCWGNFTENKIEFELVMESEQSNIQEKIEDDILELLPFPAKLKILYCAHNDPKDIVEIVRKIAKENRIELFGKLLLIIDPWVSPNTFSEGQLMGILLDSNLDIVACGKADIMSIRDGALNIRLFKNAIWEDQEAQLIF